MVYDIQNPKRLARVFRKMRKEGLHAQKSVFFYKGTEQDVDALLDRVAEVIDPGADDLRAYPIPHPAKIRITGVNPMDALPAAG